MPIHNSSDNDYNNSNNIFIVSGRGSHHEGLLIEFLEHFFKKSDLLHVFRKHKAVVRCHLTFQGIKIRGQAGQNPGTVLLVLEAAQAISPRVALSQRLPLVVLPLLRLPPVSLFPGHTPAQELKS